MPGSQPSSNTTTQQLLSPEQQQITDALMPYVDAAASTPMTTYTGPTVAGLNDTQNAANTAMLDAAYGTIDPYTNAAINTAQGISTTGASQGTSGTNNLLTAGETGTQGVGDILTGYNESGAPAQSYLTDPTQMLDVGNNPFVQASIDAALQPLTQNLTDVILPSISTEYVGNNMFGSSRQGITESNAINDYLNTAANTTAQIEQNAYDQGLSAMQTTANAMGSQASQAASSALGAGEAGTSSALNSSISALGLSPSLAQLALLPGQTEAAIGQQQQDLTQAQYNSDYNNYYTEQMLPYLQAQSLADISGSLGGNSASTTSTGGTSSSDMWNTLGSLATVAAAIPW